MSLMGIRWNGNQIALYCNVWYILKKVKQAGARKLNSNGISLFFIATQIAQVAQPMLFQLDNLGTLGSDKEIQPQSKWSFNLAAVDCFGTIAWFPPLHATHYFSIDPISFLSHWLIVANCNFSLSRSTTCLNALLSFSRHSLLALDSNFIQSILFFTEMFHKDSSSLLRTNYRNPYRTIL